jgi:hypothetical protein
MVGLGAVAEEYGLLSCESFDGVAPRGGVAEVC